MFRNAQAYLVNAQSLPVALDRLRVVTINTIQDSERMPADEAGQIKADALLRQLKALLSPVHASEQQTLHAQRLWWIE